MARITTAPDTTPGSSSGHDDGLGDQVAVSDLRDRGNIQSVQRALQLLSLFAPHRMQLAPPRKEWTVTDLARASGLHKSVTARLMATMALDGFVVQDPVTKAYRIGPQAFAVGSAYEPLTVLDRVARATMEELTARCGHASYLGVPAGRHYVFLVAVESIRSIRVSIEVGESRSYHTGAIGKVLLADLDDERIAELVGPDPLPAMTPRSITVRAELLAEIEEVRETGVAFNREESILGASSIGVPIQDGDGDIVAGLAIVFPSHIVDEREMAVLIPAVQSAGREISRRLGALGSQHPLGALVPSHANR
jgi:IclR family acetate operon transcriptional repressor